MVHVPGTLILGKPRTVRGVPGLFARNERVICVFESEQGPFVMVLVGATHRRQYFHCMAWRRKPPAFRRRYGNGNTVRLTISILEKGEEMGRFQLGSTVIMLFPKNKLVFNPLWKPGAGCALRRNDGVMSWKTKARIP